jgi:hypothetical protein
VGQAPCWVRHTITQTGRYIGGPVLFLKNINPLADFRSVKKQNICIRRLILTIHYTTFDDFVNWLVGDWLVKKIIIMGKNY